MMKRDDVFYGLKHQERLVETVEEVVEEVLDQACVVTGESFDAVADRVTWPIEVLKYKRMEIGGEDRAQRIAGDIVGYVLDSLDESYADPDGDYATPTEAMKEAALAFGRAVVADYVPWMCEPTGEVIKVTREEARDE